MNELLNDKYLIIIIILSLSVNFVQWLDFFLTFEQKKQLTKRIDEITLKLDSLVVSFRNYKPRTIYDNLAYWIICLVISYVYFYLFINYSDKFCISIKSRQIRSHIITTFYILILLKYLFLLALLIISNTYRLNWKEYFLAISDDIHNEYTKEIDHFLYIYFVPKYFFKIIVSHSRHRLMERHNLIIGIEYLLALLLILSYLYLYTSLFSTLLFDNPFFDFSTFTFNVNSSSSFFKSLISIILGVFLGSISLITIPFIVVYFPVLLTIGYLAMILLTLIGLPIKFFSYIFWRITEYPDGYTKSVALLVNLFLSSILIVIIYITKHY